MAHCFNSHMLQVETQQKLIKKKDGFQFSPSSNLSVQIVLTNMKDNKDIKQNA
jgi:hypothetical protein